MILWDLHLTSLSAGNAIPSTIGSISKELWIKRVVDTSFKPWPLTSTLEISNAIYQCDGEEKVRQFCRFANRYKLSCHYFLFIDSRDWQNSPESIIEVKFDKSGSVVDHQEIELPILKKRIRQLAGGPVKIGDKGLPRAFTTLECFLSTTDAAWPGDADLVLVDSNFTPHAIIEFKKHNLETPISGQKLSNYYPSKDKRKYNRLALFRDFLKGCVIIVIYHPTQLSIDQVKLERIKGASGELITADSTLVPLPNAGDEESCQKFIESLVRVIGL